MLQYQSLHVMLLLSVVANQQIKLRQPSEKKSGRLRLCSTLKRLHPAVLESLPPSHIFHNTSKLLSSQHQPISAGSTTMWWVLWVWVKIVKTIAQRYWERWLLVEETWWTSGTGFACRQTRGVRRRLSAPSPQHPRTGTMLPVLLESHDFDPHHVTTPFPGTTRKAELPT
jgi:hypothetical protein